MKYNFQNKSGLFNFKEAIQISKIWCNILFKHPTSFTKTADQHLNIQ